ncbi:hypothetical protein ACFSHT_13600 [Paraburkholderia silviterrae]|uniref:Uncharacterized protein n=1 Tax=Paraburkholderia silviterrae TaxID=2528715 RepID=A0A4R5LXF9_9BURK|nr:hypothetical protein [Paraburkholderia silviterrae]TDG16735.1 hypothetical protein EYW47_39915 [Paraburkholderia silviterrae]
MDHMKEVVLATNCRSRRAFLRAGSTSALMLALSGQAMGGHENATAEAQRSASPRSAGPLRSAGALEFGPGNVLFVGDITGAAVHAFVLGESDLTSQSDVEVGNFQNFEGRDLVVGLDQKLAALFGTTIGHIVVNDMAIHQPSRQIFISVARGRGPDAIPAIVKVNHGKLEVLELDRIAHTQVAIPNEPDRKAMLEFEPQRVYAITDVKYYNGEVFVTGISNQRFASTLYRIPYPFNSRQATCTVEIWHPTHGEFETRAPIIRQLIREMQGKPYLFAVYGCTPLVRFDLDELKDGAHVRGDTIGELGYGANPLDMLIYTDPFDHKEYLLVTIDVRSASRIEAAELASAKPEPTGGPIDFGPGGLGRTQRDLPIRAEHLAILDPNWAVAIWRHPKTSYRLDVGTLMVPYFFDRRLGMAEMNWPDGPDPFHYRDHRNEIDHA